MSTEKPNGKTQAPDPVESSGWFGDVFISSRISGQLSPNCNREPRELHERNPRSTVGGKNPKIHRRQRRKQRSKPPSFSSFPSVQNLRALSPLLAAERPKLSDGEEPPVTPGKQK